MQLIRFFYADRHQQGGEGKVQVPAEVLPQGRLLPRQG